MRMFQGRRSNRFVRALFGALALPASIALAAPAQMQAVVVQGTSAQPSLQVQTVATPKPGAGQVLIQVYAAGVNPVDWKAATAGAVPGFDVAGIVDAVGLGVTEFKPGDPVVARATGAYAQYALANLDSVTGKPKNFTFEQAAGIPVAGIAGYRAATVAKIQAGQRVAVIGAAGGGGSAAVETARSLGGRVIGIGHSSQESYLRKLGVAEFVAYDKDKVAEKVRDVDAVLNMVDGQADAGLGYVRRGGYFSSIAGMPGAGKCEAAGVTCVQIGRGLPGPPTVESLRPLVAMAEQGKYTITVTRRFPLAQAGAAQDYLRTNEGIGKTILVVDPAKAGQR
jgi:NADPH:quinone reductase-like Zn-dependent oxidoreductase